MAGKIFEVGDVMPLGQVKIQFEHVNNGNFYWINQTITFNNSNKINFHAVEDDGQDVWASVSIVPSLSTNYQIIDDTNAEDEAVYERRNMVCWIIIDFSNCSLEERTVTDISFQGSSGAVMKDVIWEVVPSGYSITFEENGGTSVTDLTEQTALPDPLPTPTKSGYTFVAWYYESNFQTRAKAGDTIKANTTLYAKWHNLGSLFTEIADAIRSKDGTSENIRDVDFGERIKQIQGAKEEQTKTVSPTTSSQDVLPDANKVLSKVTVNAIPTETKSQQPNLSSGDQTINATSGKFMTSFTITKDTVNHIASNIRSGTTLYGVTGNLQPAKEEETKTVTPNFSSGNQVITPISGKVLSQVTLTKPNDLLPENIAKDKNVCGVVGTSFIAIELTQTQYDALSTKDSNTYYLIVEE